jgi:hypothetical protein
LPSAVYVAWRYLDRCYAQPVVSVKADAEKAALMGAAEAQGLRVLPGG